MTGETSTEFEIGRARREKTAFDASCLAAGAPSTARHRSPPHTTALHRAIPEVMAGPRMLYGWKAIREHVSAVLGCELSVETVRKWPWLSPAIADFNGRVTASADAVERLVVARKTPRST